jgi:peptidoglycan/xylan/chitin deacetylase (PgdA/CDA1 family)
VRRAGLVSGALAVGVVVSACAAGSPATRHNVTPLPTDASPTTTIATAASAVSTPVSEGGMTIINHGGRQQPLIALTFDSNLTTSMIVELDHHRVASFDNTAVIDELDAKQVPATFFLSGKWMERYPDTVRRLAADPLFELGSHSYAHVGFAPRCYHLGLLPTSAMAADVERSEQVLQQFTDHPTRLFRFPGGCVNTAAMRAIQPAGVTVIGFDLASGDAFGHSVTAIVRNTVSSVQNGSIIVMHVTGGNTAPLTAQALPAIIDGLRGRGFTLVRVSDLLREDPPTNA